MKSICDAVGQRPRLKSYKKPAALGEEHGDDAHIPQQDASEVDDTLPYLVKLFTVSVVGTIQCCFL